MIVAQHSKDGKLVLVIIDSSLAGTKHESGARQIDFSSAFYKGTEMDAAHTAALLNRAHIIHAAGDETLSFLEQEGFEVRGSETRIGAVPLIQIVQG